MDDDNEKQRQHQQVRRQLDQVIGASYTGTGNIEMQALIRRINGSIQQLNGNLESIDSMIEPLKQALQRKEPQRKDQPDSRMEMAAQNATNVNIVGTIVGRYRDLYSKNLQPAQADTSNKKTSHTGNFSHNRTSKRSRSSHLRKNI